MPPLICPRRTQGLQAEPHLFHLFFRVGILLPSAVTPTPIFSTYNEKYFFTGFFQFSLSTLPLLIPALVLTQTYTHASTTKWACRKRNLSMETKVYGKDPREMPLKELTVNSRALTPAIECERNYCYACLFLPTWFSILGAGVPDGSICSKLSLSISRITPKHPHISTRKPNCR